jgi:hypothetical protein
MNGTGHDTGELFEAMANLRQGRQRACRGTGLANKTTKTENRPN